MKDLPDQTLERMSQILTTEHFTLQGARNGTIAEANGRLSHYLSTVGSGVVTMMPFHSRIQQLASTPGPVILVNSFLVGAFAGILAAGFF